LGRMETLRDARVTFIAAAKNFPYVIIVLIT